MFDASRPAAGGVDLFGLAQRRLDWLDNREQILASNIANADTPEYVAKDMAPFESMLSQFGGELATTSERHIAGKRNVNQKSNEASSTQSLDGNRVSLETQMQLVAETSDQQRLATNVYSSYRSMLNSVLGK
ncbi:flagellar basal-body rod protein FlgB [Acetobacter aceti NRIC 0242]|uniref:Flagellar basal-body rod protein FlgB n=1 Tax=Acetobacter aceti NBRC 14818 TaxID=887700 RepID=A0AB33IBV1_ACEAC|nr:flagellar biosynthesis protein FlgB [Acetobacter aceti]TCS34182.1 flagellar basal-body rod protein FlgB [Acetobacter aceti NBRC 14818]BCK75532.1 flagellar basal-body rod protein FlgB [Acetobacter aceti NBRC 14818]GAN56705.1 flagellar basal-body rod protein FlgB [Acetobacter aceti NBRC 14818]GBO79781.1 flagellar basal-body rod protein FlgB [Acetobacter aceti NRIC 0242]